MTKNTFDNKNRLLCMAYKNVLKLRLTACITLIDKCFEIINAFKMKCLILCGFYSVTESINIYPASLIKTILA